MLPALRTRSRAGEARRSGPLRASETSIRSKAWGWLRLFAASARARPAARTSPPSGAGLGVGAPEGLGRGISLTGGGSTRNDLNPRNPVCQGPRTTMGVAAEATFRWNNRPDQTAKRQAGRTAQRLAAGGYRACRPAAAGRDFIASKWPFSVVAAIQRRDDRSVVCLIDGRSALIFANVLQSGFCGPLMRVYCAAYRSTSTASAAWRTSCVRSTDWPRPLMTMITGARTYDRG